MNHLAAFILTGTLLASCVATPEPFPNIDESVTKDIVAVVRFQGATYLQEFPECNDPDIICMDPPPFKMKAEVIEQIFGPRLPRFISFYSTSHYGIPPAREDALELVHLVSDGTAYLMPRYHSVLVGEDSGGELVIPAHPDEIYWLPCGTDALKSEVNFKYPRDRFSQPTEYLPQKWLNEHPEYLVSNGKSARLRYGIEVDKLSQFLNSLQPSGKDAFSCIRNN
jgi:hypothetical protein